MFIKSHDIALKVQCQYSSIFSKSSSSLTSQLISRNSTITRAPYSFDLPYNYGSICFVSRPRFTALCLLTVIVGFAVSIRTWICNQSINMCFYEKITFPCNHTEYRLASYCHFARNDPGHQCFGAWNIRREWKQSQTNCADCTRQQAYLPMTCDAQSTYGIGGRK